MIVGEGHCQFNKLAVHRIAGPAGLHVPNDFKTKLNNSLQETPDGLFHLN